MPLHPIRRLQESAAILAVCHTFKFSGEHLQLHPDQFPHGFRVINQYRMVGLTFVMCMDFPRVDRDPTTDRQYQSCPHC